MALYRGERDTPDEAPTPQDGHRSNVQVLNMARCGPVFGKAADWAKRRLTTKRLCTSLLGLHLS